MFKRLMKAIPVSLVALITLTSCTLLENILGTVLVNAVMNLDVLVNGVDLIPEGLEVAPEFVKWDPMPLEPNKRAELTYLKNVLIVPNSVSASIFGINLKVEFETEFISDVDVTTSFKKITINSSELPDGFNFDLSGLPFPVNFALDIYIPVGDSDILDGVSSFNDLESLVDEKTASDILAATDQEEIDVTLRISAKSGKTQKSKSFYFHLIKPEFGEVIMDQVLDSGLLINVFHFETDGEPTYRQVTNLPTDENNPLIIEYLKDTIVIPQSFTIKDVGDVIITPTLSVIGNLDIFFASNITKNIKDIDESIDIIEGNITASTFTPVGTYYEHIPENVATIEDFSDHIKAKYEEQDTLKRLYNASQGPAVKFSLDITIDVPGGDHHQDIYYFQLDQPVFDDELVDFAIKSDFILNKIYYKNTNNPISISNQGQSETDPIELEYLTETIAIPKQVEIDGFDDRLLEFDVEFLSDEADRNLFYNATKVLNEEATSVEGANVTMQTLTPIGTKSTLTTPENKLDDFAQEVETMAQNEPEELFKIANQETSETPIHIRVNLRLESKKGENPATRYKDYYIRLVPADIDQDIVNFVAKENALLNVVNYKAITSGENADYSKDIQSIGSAATSESNPYVIEHMVDTLVIPESIKLASFGNKTVTIDSEITNVSSGETFVPFIGHKDNLNFEGKYSIDAKTITPVGTFESAVEDGDLDAFGAEIQALPTTDLYKYSQGTDITFTVIVTTTIMESGLRTDKTATSTFYIKVVQADIDNDIIDYLFPRYDILYKLNNQELSQNTQEQTPLKPNTENDRHVVKLFYDTLIMPTNFKFNDFGEKEIEFRINYTSDYFVELSKNDYIYQGEEISALTLTAVGSYEPTGTFRELNDLINYIFTNIGDIINANNQEQPMNMTISISVGIKGNESSFITQTYYFTFVPF